jgi:hypothetical protein
MDNIPFISDCYVSDYPWKQRQKTEKKTFIALKKK